MKRILPILILISMNTTAHSQDWVDTSAYPFNHQFLQLDAGRMHYIDEGDGPTILFVHGTPTWSFLYRAFIQDLSKDFRCVAIDHLGFGLSEKPADAPGTPEWHAANLGEFIRKMDLQDVTLVVHDFGGPIGLAAGIQHHERIRQVVLMNSWLWETEHNPDALKIDKVVHGGIGKFLYLNLNLSPRVLLKKGFSDKKKLTRHIHWQYIQPFPTKASRVPLLNLAKSLVGSSDWYQQQWTELDRLTDKPWLILWGIHDEFISTDDLKKWKGRLSNAEVHELDCGHFLQEEKPEQGIRSIRGFMTK